MTTTSLEEELQHRTRTIHATGNWEQLSRQYAQTSTVSHMPHQPQIPFNPYHNSLSKQWPQKSHPDTQSKIGPNCNLCPSDTPTESTSFPRQQDRVSSIPRGVPSRPPSFIEDQDLDDDLSENQTRPTRRLSGACRQCKKLKTKCEIVTELNICRRCKVKGQVCLFEGRKKTEHKHEILIAQLRNKEATIDILLKEIRTRRIDDRNSYLDADTELHQPPNKAMQTWIQNLYKRFPSDVNNDWSLPSTELVQHQVQHRMRKERNTFVGVKGSGSNSSDSWSKAGNTVDEDIEGSLPPLHPILLHHVPSIPAPLGYIADLRMRSEQNTGRNGTSDDYDNHTGGNGSDGLENIAFGIANSKYFHPGPAIDIDQRRFYIERKAVPDMLMHGLITMDDVDALFDIYFERMNTFVSLLDPILHTPSNTFSRCPFLFTIICAIASRYYPPKRAMYKYGMHFAKLLAGEYLVSGWKTVELCQAYILLSTFSIPAKKWEEDRSRLYLELAIRIALDLNLHQPPDPQLFPTEKYERENLNRTRTWFNCYNLDCSMSTLLGRPAVIDKNIIDSNPAVWYTRSRYNHPYDVHLCAYTETMHFMSRFHEAVRGNTDEKRDLRFYKRVTLHFSDLLDDIHARIAERYDRDSDKNDSGCVFRTGLLPLVINYYRLVMFSFGLQQAVDQGIQKDDIFFQNCFDAACAVITSMIDILAPTGYMRFSPDGYIVFTAFAAAFLLKLLRPDFTKIVKRSHKDQISTLVRKLIRFLGSAEVAVDDQHTPKLYSRFLTELLARMFPSRSRASGTAGDALKTKLEQPGQKADEQDPTWSAEQGEQRPEQRQGQGQGQGQGKEQIVCDVEGGDKSLEQNDAVHEFRYYTEPAVDNTTFNHPQVLPQPPPLQPLQDEQAIFASAESAWTDGYMVDETMTLPALTTEEYTLSMQAINNPGWWENAMMPGFSWPPVLQDPSVSAGGTALVSQSQSQYQHEYPYQGQMEAHGQEGVHGLQQQQQPQQQPAQTHHSSSALTLDQTSQYQQHQHHFVASFH